MPGEHELSVEGIFGLPADPRVPSGWIALTPASFSAITADKDLTNFFNGGEPRWEAIVNLQLRRLQLTESLLERTRRRITEERAGIELLIGPTGEGKSTALRQAAVALAQENSLTIFWRQQPDAALDQSVLDIANSYGSGVVLIADSAHLVLEQLHGLIERDSIPSSSGLQLLLACRDTDWTRQVRELGFKINPAEAWKSKGPIVSTKHPFGRVSESDALKIIRSWRALETRSPTSIQGLSDGEAARLLREKSTGAAVNRGALLGGLLAVRRTPEELRAHLVDLLDSLARDVTPGTVTLADVVIVLALADVAGLDGIPSDVVAEFCGVSEFSFRSQVANRLGQEAVANYSGDIIQSRHLVISESILGISLSDSSSFDVETVAIHLLASVNTVGRGRNFKAGHGQVLGLGHELYGARIEAGLTSKSKRLAIALARKACELGESVLSNHMALSHCLRLEKRADEAIEDVWMPIAGRLHDKANWQDWNKNSRTAINEFAITASLSGDEVEAVILRMAALSDIYQPNRLEEHRVVFTLHGLALHLYRLYQTERESWFADTLVEVHGCLLRCFSYDVEAVAAATQYLNDVGRRPQMFKAPADFVRALNVALEKIAMHGSGYLDTASWCSRIRFVELEAFIGKACLGVGA